MYNVFPEKRRGKGEKSKNKQMVEKKNQPKATHSENLKT